MCHVYLISKAAVFFLVIYSNCSWFCFCSKVEQRNIAQACSGRNLQQTEATATKMPALKVTLLPCNSTACLRFGTPDTNGLCEDCYRKKVNTQPSTTSTTEASKQQRGPSVSGNYRSAQTTTQNRQFSNSSQSASCVLPGPVQVSQTQRSGVRHQNSNSGNDDISGQKCHGTNCTLFGTPETSGYCSRCFLESTIPLSYPHSIPGNVHKIIIVHVALSISTDVYPGCQRFAQTV